MDGDKAKFDQKKRTLFVCCKSTYISMFYAGEKGTDKADIDSISKLDIIDYFHNRIQ